MSLERAPLLADGQRRGQAWCASYTAAVDTWLASLFASTVGGSTGRLALVAVGGYGRAELCPESDIDVMLVHEGRAAAAGVAEQIWYPIWDAGIHLGHSVCTPAQALALADDDLHTSTALLSARHLAGDAALTARLARDAEAQWERRAKKWLTELGLWVTLAHEQAGDVAFSLEPDLKEGRGAMRDVHALRWAHTARPVLGPDDERALTAAYDVLLSARVELQRLSGRPSNVLALDHQDPVAEALGWADADALMRAISQAARVIAWTSDDAWRRIRIKLRGPLGRVGRRGVRLSAEVVLRDGELHAAGPLVTPLAAAADAAAHGAVLAPETLEALATSPIAEPWTEPDRADFVRLLLAGRPAVPVIEALDHRGLWERILPEWVAVRARPQRNAYHRFTVDRHLLETAANAARLASSVARPDLLVTAAVLHDIGKGSDGDHTDAGVALAGRITARMGWPAADADTIVELVRHHLLLAEVATRRDLDDPDTVGAVARALGTVERVELLAALTEADSIATGPSAWSTWKAELVTLLADRVTHVLANGDQAIPVPRRFPSPEQLTRLAEGGRRIDALDEHLTVMCDDRRGTFSRVAGVLTLHGLDVVGAVAHSTESGRALSEFRVGRAPSAERGGWARVVEDLEQALDGRLALTARIAERAVTYRRRGRLHGTGTGPAVAFDNDSSSSATIIDVHATDAVGLLYRITRALAELDLDIRSAKIETRGAFVTDSFYVRDGRGAKVTDTATLAEITRALMNALAP